MTLISDMNIVINISVTISLMITFAISHKLILQKKRKKHTKDKTVKHRKSNKNIRLSFDLKIKL